MRTGSRSWIDPRSRAALGMILPYVLHFLAFLAYPLVFSLLLVFHRWDVFTPMEWVGLANIARLLRDEWFLRAILNTIVFVSIHIPLQLVLALVFAMLLNANIRGRGFFRATYFLPVVVSGVVVSFVWLQIYSYESGILNQLLVKLGLPRLPWLTSRNLAMPSIALMATWKNVGLYIVLFLAGLQSIPQDLYEVAELDGANAWQKFRRITLPMLNPTVVLVIVLSTIGGFSLFIEPYMMTDGGPENSTLSAVLYIYRQAFDFYRMGYAATLGVAFALMILAVVLLQRRVAEAEHV
ncbi:MAG: sugar ABC transporter permease [candidate division KSB1 bacterium]|nr:sugar ABC transporter permease [candidate division KSB1 bacterium]